MRKTEKKVCVILGTAMLVCATIGCGNNATESKGSQKTETKEEASYFNKEGYPICTKPITISVSGGQGSTTDWQDTIMAQQIKERFGIDMQCKPINNDDWNTKWTLMVNGNEVPDLVINANLNNVEVKNYGSQGYLLDLGKYLDIMPSLKEYLDKHPDYAATCMDDKGAIYGLCGDSSENPIGLYARTYINQKWLDNLGLQVPTTIDELYDVLKSFKEKDANGNGDPNDEIPMNYTDVKPYLDSTLLNAYKIYTMDPGSSDCIFQADENNKVYLADESDNYKEYLKFLAKLYKEGIMYSETYTATPDDIAALAAEDRIGFAGVWAPYVMAKQDVSYDQNWTAIVGMTSKVNSEMTVSKDRGVSAPVRAVVGADTKYPEAICRLLDYFFTDEGRLAQKYGWDGLSFDWIQHPEVDIKYPNIRHPEGYKSAEEFRCNKAIINGGFIFTEGNSVKFNELLKLDYSAMDDAKFKSLQKTEGWVISLAKELQKKGLKQVSTYPSLSYPSTVADEQLKLKTDIRSILKTAKANFITGVWDIDGKWDDYKSELSKAGVEKLLKIEQETYDAYMKKQQ